MRPADALSPLLLFVGSVKGALFWPEAAATASRRQPAEAPTRHPQQTPESDPQPSKDHHFGLPLHPAATHDGLAPRPLQPQPKRAACGPRGSVSWSEWRGQGTAVRSSSNALHVRRPRRTLKRGPKRQGYRPEDIVKLHLCGPGRGPDQREPVLPIRPGLICPRKP